MVAVPLLAGIVSGPAAEFIETWPLNLEPTAVDAKIGGKGQFKSPPGVDQAGIGPGADRGGIEWNGRHFRVLGTSFCEIGATGELTVIGVVEAGPKCGFDYGFDRLGIWTGTRLYYFDGALLKQVTDPDLGAVIDGIWIDGYFMSTDGSYVIVTELNDPTEVKPLKYGSAETDPDAITGIIKYREEAYVLGRNTIQTLRNVGGNGFPFQSVKGGTIPYGCVGPAAKCKFGDGFAFVGSGRNEELNIFAGGQGTATPFGTRAVCDALNAVDDQTQIELEQRDYAGEIRLLVHLPAETWCFLVNVSKRVGQPVWYRLSSGERYRLRHMTLAYGRRWVGDTDSGRYGTLDDTRLEHWGDLPEWQFEAGMLYNNGQPFVIHSAELVGLPGRGQGTGTIFLSMTRDGETWSTERALTAELGSRAKRLQWRPHARFANYMGFRFRGRGAALPGIASLEVNVASLGPGQ